MLRRFFVVFFFFSFFSIPAGASTPHYQMFGNDVVGDCPEAAMANLTLHQFPNTKITTAQVEGVLANYQVLDAYVQDGYNAYLITSGFGGHKATLAPLNLGVPNSPALDAVIEQAANAGGVLAQDSVYEAPAYYSNGVGYSFPDHEVAITAANAQGVWIVTWGKLVFRTWAWWNQYGSFALGVTWAK